MARLLPLLSILVGLAILAVPLIADLVSQSALITTTSSISSAADGFSDPQELADAQTYNALKGGYDLPEGWDSSMVSPYDQQMDVDAAMAYVDIPAIAVKMPIYHGTSDESLAAGIGHLEGTSLPVGGQSANCVLTAHSGMSGMRAFDDINRLRDGDIVLVHSLGQTLAYQVAYQETKVISDHDYDAWYQEIAIQQGKDELTLVTCTPYGVNDHRYILHCYRTDYTGPDMEAVPASALLNPRYLVPLAFLALVVVAALLALRRHRRSRRRA